MAETNICMIPLQRIMETLVNMYTSRREVVTLGSEVVVIRQVVTICRQVVAMPLALLEMLTVTLESQITSILIISYSNCYYKIYYTLVQICSIFLICFCNFCDFSQRSNDTRPSSVDSDGENDNLMPIMRSISHDEQTPQTPGVLRKVR